MDVGGWWSAPRPQSVSISRLSRQIGDYKAPAIDSSSHRRRPGWEAGGDPTKESSQFDYHTLTQALIAELQRVGSGLQSTDGVGRERRPGRAVGRDGSAGDASGQSSAAIYWSRHVIYQIVRIKLFSLRLPPRLRQQQPRQQQPDLTCGSTGRNHPDRDVFIFHLRWKDGVGQSSLVSQYVVTARTTRPLCTMGCSDPAGPRWRRWWRGAGNVARKPGGGREARLVMWL